MSNRSFFHSPKNVHQRPYCIFGDSGFFRHQGIKILWRLQFLKGATIRLPEDLKDSPFKLKVLKYSRNCGLHSTLIPNLVKALLYILDTWIFCISSFFIIQILDILASWLDCFAWKQCLWWKETHFHCIDSWSNTNWCLIDSTMNLKFISKNDVPPEYL